MAHEHDTETQSLEIEGMSCNNCAATVTKFLEREGLQDVRVDFTTGTAKFRATKPLNPAALSTGISKLGYRVKSTDAATKHVDHEKRLQTFLIISAVCTAPLLLLMLPNVTFLHNPLLQIALTIPPMIIGLLYFGKNSINALKVGVLHMDVLVLIGVVSAFVYSVYGTFVLRDMNYMFYETAASIVTLVLLGHYIEHRAVRKTRQAVKDLQQLMPETAQRINFYGNPKFEVNETVSADAVKTEDYLLVRSGDKIAADGEVVWGNGAVAEELLTGEAEPQPKRVGDKLLAGSVMTNGNVKMKVTASGDQTVIASIVQLVTNTKAAKPAIQRLADKITTVFVPVVLAIALVTFVVNRFMFDVTLSESIMRAVAVLVISCPCAMGLATPTAVVVGLGIAARKGILIKDANVLELMPKLQKVIFDKTGTLTSGHFEVIDVKTNPESLSELKQVIGSLEKHSSHPIAKSLFQKFGNENGLVMKDVTEIAGVGVEGKTTDGTLYNITSYANADGSEHGVTVKRNGLPLGIVLLRDALRNGSKDAVDFFNHQGVETVMLSGDRQQKAEQIAHEVGIKRVYGGMLPQQKLDAMENESCNAITMMVGDGINDAPAMAKAQIGVALSHSSSLTGDAAQVILLNSRIDLLPKAYQISSATYKTIRQNLFWAFFYNVIAIPFAAFGLLSPIIAAGAMAMSDVVVIGNALRLRLRKF